MTEPNTLTNIKQWAEDDRPREKLIKKGKHSLSDAELLAILIGTGSRNLTAVDLAKKILQLNNNNLFELGKRNISELKKIKGIGEAKAISIIAAIELGKRRSDATPDKQEKINSSKDAFHLLFPLLESLQFEQFWVFYLNRSNKVISKELIGQGGITGTVADVRIILRNALEKYATGILIAHNHPSGNLQPSENDKQLTKKIKDACSYFDVALLDHIIFTDRNYFSFADEGLI